MKPRFSFWLVFAALPLALAACGSSSKNVTTNLQAPQPSVSMQSAGPTTALPATVTSAVNKTVTGYVRSGILAPIKTGGDATNLSNYFNAETLAPATGKDADTVLDQELPKATGKINGTISNYEFIGLADKTGAISMVAVKLDTQVKTKNKNGSVTIKRSGDLVVVPDGPNWKIGGYNLNVARTGPGIPKERQQ